MVLRGWQRHVVHAVGDDEERNLGTGEQFFEHDARSGVAKGLVDHRRFNRGFRGLAIGGHDHAFAGGQAVGLDDERVAELAGANRLERGLGGGADAVARGRHVVPLHEILGERLARLELRRALRGTEHPPALGLESIGQPVAERRFRADDRQIDLRTLDEPNHRLGVQYVDWFGGNGARDAGVARRANHVADAGFIGELPGQGVLARAGAQNTDSHGR